MSDIGTILNLVCLKYTGQLLPVNWCGSPEWSYTTDPTDSQKKIAIYNPFVSTLLRNPFQFISDSHPIEHQIKRSMINDQIKLVFKKTITLDAIESAMKGKYPHFEGCDSLTPMECQNLRDIQLQLLCSHAHDLFEPINDVCQRGALDRVMLSNEDLPRYRSNAHEIFIHTILLANSHNPYIRSILHTMTLESTPSKWLKRCRRISKRCSYEFFSSINFNGRHKDRPEFGGQDWGDITTQDGLCPIKREHWYPWWIISLTSDCEKFYGRPIAKYSHNRRTKAKINWWGYVKKESGCIIEYPDKEKHQERLVQSILAQ